MKKLPKGVIPLTWNDVERDDYIKSIDGGVLGYAVDIGKSYDLNKKKPPSFSTCSKLHLGSGNYGYI